MVDGHRRHPIFGHSGSDRRSHTWALAPWGVRVVPLVLGLRIGFFRILIRNFFLCFFFSDIRPDDVTPSLWVVMGAAAISTNAGSVLVLTDSGISFLQSMRPFIEGVTPLIWAWGTWWIPLLALLGIWQHVVCRVPLSYTPTLFSPLFPLRIY